MKDGDRLERERKRLEDRLLRERQKVRGPGLSGAPRPRRAPGGPDCAVPLRGSGLAYALPPPAPGCASGHAGALRAEAAPAAGSGERGFTVIRDK